MITVSVGVGSSLLLEPARELLFPLPDVTSDQRPRCRLSLTNLSPRNDVVFRVRTRNPEAFTVRPAHGLLVPGANCVVVMTAAKRTCERLGAMDPRDLMTRQSSELFLVQSVEREDATEPLNPGSSSSLRSFWKKVPKHRITENKMVCRFTDAASGSLEGVTQDEDLFSRNASNTSMNSQEYRSSRSGSSSERSRVEPSFSNQFIPPEETRREERRSRNQSIVSDDSFHTTIEPPMMDRRSELRVSTSANYALPTTSMPRLRDSVLTSVSVNDSSVSSDTMLSAQSAFSTDTAAGEPTLELGPLIYHIQPSDMLTFDVKPAERFWGSTSFFVVNASQKDCLAFKVRTSNQSGYVVKPSRGIISTTNAQEVTVQLCAPRDESSFDPVKREAKDGFMIEVANISRDKYNELMKLDQRKRTREISSLWSLIPRSARESTMLSVDFKMEGSESGSGTRASSESSDAQSKSNSNVAKSRPEEDQRKSLRSVTKDMKVLSTTATDESPESQENEKLASIYQYSDSDESAFTIAPTPMPTENGGSDSGSEEAVVYTSVANAPRDSSVIVVSADRMDTVDFSNPKLSFFI